MSVDQTTEKMMQETGHNCLACPREVRNLMATAHNALSQWDANRESAPDWARLSMKMESLRGALHTIQSFVDEHFEALNGWRRP